MAFLDLKMNLSPDFTHNPWKKTKKQGRLEILYQTFLATSSKNSKNPFNYLKESFFSNNQKNKKSHPDWDGFLSVNPDRING